MRVLVTRALTPRVEAVLRAEFDVEIRTDDTPLTRAAAMRALSDFDAILPTLGDDFGARSFDGAIRTRMLANFGVGYNHIDVARARAVGITVTNTPGAVTDATADIALTLILMSARRAAEGERLVRAGGWTGWQPTQMLGQHVTGKRLGVIGMGRIGRAIARRCHYGFGMEVVFHNRSAVDPGLPARQVSLAQALGADFVVLAVPSSPETRHLIGAAELAQMAPHAHLINIARGEIVDEVALIAALQARQIGGAGLDVYEFEPAVPQALRDLGNVTLLPHLGTATEEVRDAMGLMAVENLRAFRDGKAPPNVL
ncbi:MAG: D-glycerate dehydrogenase [Paracoccaceae bacterium]|nr:D-glycerate dehydrogenase [Paracoccaceae bacterium]